MKPIYPIDGMYFFNTQNITQSFAAPSPHYKSGIHPGTDFLCPVGTPIVAPVDLDITWRCSDHPSLGAAIYVSFEIQGVRYYARFLHLSKAMQVGSYKQGAIIGLTGNSGGSSGPHLHHDLWNRPIDAQSILTAAGVRKNMLDPVLFWKGMVEGGTCAGEGL